MSRKNTQTAEVYAARDSARRALRREELEAGPRRQLNASQLKEARDRAAEDGAACATPDGLDRARAMTHGRFKHLGANAEAIEQLAMQVPMTWRERRLLEDQQAHTSGFRYVPRKTRGNVLQVEASEASVAGFVSERGPFESSQHLAASVAAANGYRYGEIPRVARRVGRFMAKLAEGVRVPDHIRRKAVLLSAIALGVKQEFPAEYAAGASMAGA